MIEQQVKTFVLRALLAARGPLGDDTLKGAIRSAFPGVAFTNGDLTQWTREMENSQLIAGTRDDITGTMWDLTTKGKIKAQQLS